MVFLDSIQRWGKVQFPGYNHPYVGLARKKWPTLPIWYGHYDNGYIPFEIKWDRIMYSGIAPILIWSHVEISWFKLIFTVLKRFFILAKEILKNQLRIYLVVDWDKSGSSEQTRKRLQTRFRTHEFLKNFGYVCSSYSSTFLLKLSKLNRIMSTIMCFMGIWS